MRVQWEAVQVGGRSMPLYIGSPGTGAEAPAMVVIQHAGGVDAPIQDMVHRLCREGYAAAAPALFHRQPAEGLDPIARIGQLHDHEVMADVDATVELLRTRGHKAIGIVGFCMGGRVSYLAACANTHLRAAVVFYGGNIMKSWGAGPSPFERTATIGCPVAGFFGADDTNPSPADVQAISSELTRLGKWHEFQTYQEAGHAFHNFTTERYRERAARASFAAMIAFLEEKLGPGMR